jgi:hypothetical protein
MLYPPNAGAGRRTAIRMTHCVRKSTSEIKIMRITRTVAAKSSTTRWASWNHLMRTIHVLADSLMGRHVDVLPVGTSMRLEKTS